jgi:hypothetical protein
MFHVVTKHNIFRFVRDTALENWRAYEDKDDQPEGHLLSYPVDISVSVQEGVPVVTLIARTKVKAISTFHSHFSIGNRL